MELQFAKQEVRFLRCVLSQVQDLEQTQELRLPEGMSGVDRILGCWGQVLIRSKQWQRDSIRITGGTQLWVLYAAGDGGNPCCQNTWIPFQMDWDLPDRCAEGEIIVQPLVRFCDARAVSAGKLMLRLGLAVQVQAWIPQEAAVYAPGEIPGEVELLRSCWPVRLAVEAGEKAFPLEEVLELPAAAPRPAELVCCCMMPEVSDQKVLADKIAFRGAGGLHILYMAEDGGVYSWDFELPFSQFAQLSESHSPEARCSLTLAVTSLEAESDGEGRIHLKAGLTAQYLTDDRQVLELVEDAWCPVRALEVRREDMELPLFLDSRREVLSGQQSLPMEADTVADGLFLPDFPRMRREGERIMLEQGGMAQLLFQNREGTLQGTQEHLEGSVSLGADMAAQVTAWPVSADLEAVPQGEGMQLRWETAMQVLTMGGQGLPMVTGLTMGEKQEPDPARPSLVLRRAGQQRLWDLARAHGSTVGAIMEANGLEEQPEPDKLLLIPVL